MKIFRYLSLITLLLSAYLSADAKVLALDFGGVVLLKDTKQERIFLKKSLELSEFELEESLVNLKRFIKEGGDEEEFWESIAFEKQISLPEDWIENLEQIQQASYRLNEGLLEKSKALKEKGKIGRAHV